jgi:hypothetical protein
MAEKSAELTAAQRPKRLPGPKKIALGVAVSALVVLVVFAVLRESGTNPANATVVKSSAPSRPALTASEEAYAAALWPVHEQVKNNAIRMTFAGLSYKMGETEASAVTPEVAPLVEEYKAAALRVGALRPPSSLDRLHKDYLDALRLYQDAAGEMVKVSNDGSEDHLMAAQTLTERAAETLLKVGDVIWPAEYKPN